MGVAPLGTLRLEHLANLVDHHRDLTRRAQQQEIRNMPPKAPPVSAGQLERLRSDRGNVPVIIGEHDPRQLQPAFISHQPAHR
jgi:hypothetical protein